MVLLKAGFRSATVVVAKAGGAASAAAAARMAKCFMAQVTPKPSAKLHPPLESAACAAANRAIGTRNGEQLT